MAKNQLYYGDNLDVLKRYVKDESVDLVYLDPPFNSRQDYSAFFKEKDGRTSASQIMAFEDTWSWNTESKSVYDELVAQGDKVSDVMRAFHTFIHGSDMMAYLAMMAPRLVELKRVLKPTGSIYLHCDPTASHYLKLLMDAVFGPQFFQNEISWRRSSAHSDTKQGMRRCGRVRDILLFYSKSAEQTWNPQYTPYPEGYLESEYRHVMEDGRHYKEADLTAARPGGDTEYDWHVKRLLSGKGTKWQADLNDEYLHPLDGWEYRAVPPYNGRYWAYSHDNLVEFAKDNKLIHRATGMPRLVLYANEMPGIGLQDDWDDIGRTAGAEDLGYPTQKPEALLERIVAASSNEGELVLDPFCGCGTAIAAAQKLKRRWIGIDVTHLAVGLIKQRLQDAFGLDIRSTYEVIGEPTDFESAKALAGQDRFQFQAWALGLVGARRATSSKRGADHGVDGKLVFRDAKDDVKEVILSVKSGGVQVRDVRDLVGTIEREKAAIGVLITLEEPSKPMLTEAVDAGFFKSEHFTDKVSRIQILTIEQLLSGARIDFPRLAEETFKKAPKAKAAKAENLTLDLE